MAKKGFGQAFAKEDDVGLDQGMGFAFATLLLASDNLCSYEARLLRRWGSTSPLRMRSRRSSVV
jgi:hypothetical protein